MVEKISPEFARRKLSTEPPLFTLRFALSLFLSPFFLFSSSTIPFVRRETESKLWEFFVTFVIANAR